MIEESYREWNRSHDQIRRRGAVGNLNRGIEVTANGVAARLIAWPGNGFQTESVHVLTLKPGDASDHYRYDLAEEAFLCLAGRGEIYVRGKWVAVEPGDLAFIPAAVPRGVRNPARNGDDFVLVNQITPPQFHVYEPAGFYNREHGVMNFDAIEAAKLDAKPGNLAPATDVRLRESDPDVRPWNLTAEQIRQEGALFNVFRGTGFGGLGTPMLLVLWPGYGVRSAGLHMGGTPAGARAEIHTHPVSDECLFNWIGRGQVYCDDKWMESEPFDVLLAPCGVHHSVGGPADLEAGPSYGCGFASPPQLDLYIRTPFFHDGAFESPPWTTLSQAPAPATTGAGS
jgi:mannose-6-phosphate isomerase-like protein (cupin superfamily)